MGRIVKCLDCGYADGKMCLLDGSGNVLQDPSPANAVFLEFGPGEAQKNSRGVEFSPQVFNPAVSRIARIPTDRRVTFGSRRRIITGERFGLPCEIARTVWFVSWDNESYEIDLGERPTGDGTYAIDCNTLEAVMIERYWERSALAWEIANTPGGAE